MGSSDETGIEKVREPSNVNPFAKPADERIAAGTVAIESERAIAEAQGRLVIAKRFPRDRAKAWAAIMEECKRPGLAEEALYSFPRGGQTVEGPSIRLAEVLARCWGNIDFGLRELSRRGNESEMEAYAWDLETNTRSPQQFIVRHIRDTRGGGKALTDERDIYEIGANQGARRMRARILALIPGDVIDDAVAQCRKTLEGGGGVPLADRVKSMLSAFAEMGIASQRVEERLGHSLSSITAAELVDLKGAYKAIRDNVAKADEVFPVAGADEKSKGATESLKDLLAKSAAPKAEKPTGEKAREPTDELADALDRMTLAQSDKEINGLLKAAAGWPAVDQEPLIEAAAKRRAVLKAGGAS